MGCPSCGAENPLTNKFCGHCGAALVLACAKCDERNPPTNQFCGACGTRLGMANAASPSVQAADTTVQPPPESYTPRHLAEKILAGRNALAGERKQVTVLFADVVGSTELIRDRDPEETQQLLDGVVQLMMDAVHRYVGTVSRLMGDGLMAMFGAPVAHEDHAVRACYAALAMLDSVRGDAEEARQAYRAAPEIRVGLNSGEVIVRLISDDLHMDYTAMGQTVHLASRMEGLANEGTALLSPSTLALAEGFIDVRTLGPMAVKGLGQPVEVFELRGAGMARTRLQAAAARGLTPFVGRQEERAAIERALAQARAGHGQVVALVAEAGVGKSRLVLEATRADQASGFRMLQTGAVSYGRTTAWLPVSDLFRDYFQIESRDDHAAMRDKVTAGVRALEPRVDSGLPAIQSLLDLPVDDDVWTALDPPQRRAATLDAVRRLLLRESQEQPVLLVFEDLHWVDAETQAFLDGLVEALPTARVLLLVNYRPEYTHAWGNKSYYTQLRIDPLGPSNADELLAALLGDDPSIRLLKSLLIARTDGNPFFLEESARSLLETGVLVGQRGDYRLHGTIDSVQVPSTVQAVLAARIDRLPSEDKRLLQTAAVIGKDVPFILLQAVADGTDTELQAGIARLQAAELLYAVRLFPDLELTFKHALTHEVAYGSLLQERRRPLHAKIVDAIEALYPDRLDEQIERLAHHALRGQLWEKALTYSRDAGVRAMARSAGLEAIDHFERALVVLEQLPSDQSRVPLAIDLRFELRTALASRFRYERAQQVLEQAQTLATASGDRVRLGWVEAYLAHHMRSTVNHRRAIDHGEQALAIAAETGDARLRRTAADIVSQSYHEIGEFQRVQNLLGPFVASVDAASADEIGQMDIAASVSSRNVLALCLAWQGNARAAIECVEEGVRIAERLGHLQTIVSANNWSGLVAAVSGDMPRAVERTERGLAIRRSLDGDPHPSLFAFLGYVYTQSGRVEEAIRALEHSLAGAKEINHFACTALWTSWLADAYQRAGRLDEAQQTATRAIEMGRNHRERPFEGYALLQLGRVTLDESPLDAPRAEQYFWDALAIADALGMRPLQAQTHLSLGRLYRRTGRPHEARAALNISVDLYLSMEMTDMVAEVEAEIGQLPEMGG